MDLLFKYRPVSNYSIPMLRNGTVWLATPVSFNDPFDCKATLLAESIPSLDEDWAERLINQFIFLLEHTGKAFIAPYGLKKSAALNLAFRLKHLLKNGQTQIAYKVWLQYFRRSPVVPKDWEPYMPSKLFEDAQNALQNIGVLSLTKSELHPLMWAHYASEHRGFCVGWNIDCKKNNASNSICKSVEYVNQFPSLDCGEVRVETIISPGAVARRLLGIHDVNLQNIIFTKSRDWEYEQEWRYVESEGNREVSAPGSLSEIVFGLRCADADRKAVIQAVKNSSNPTSIKFYEIL